MFVSIKYTFAFYAFYRFKVCMDVVPFLLTYEGMKFTMPRMPPHGPGWEDTPAPIGTEPHWYSWALCV